MDITGVAAVDSKVANHLIQTVAAARLMGASVIVTGLSADVAQSLVALGVNQVVAMFWFVPRPFVTLHGVTTLLAHSADDSFPSDHAVIAGALAIGTLLFARKWGIVAIVVAVLLAFARVYAGMHYPLDVIAGLAIGAVVAWVLVGLVGKRAESWLRVRRADSYNL